MVLIGIFVEITPIFISNSVGVKLFEGKVPPLQGFGVRIIYFSTKISPLQR